MMDYRKLLAKVAHKQFHHHRSDFKIANQDFMTSFRDNQIESKTWLANSIVKVLGDDVELEHVAVLGSWNGVLLYELLSSQIKVKHWHFFDLNEKTHLDRDLYFEANDMEKNYTSYTADVNNLFSDEGYHRMFDLIINPSGEHMYDLMPAHGPVYALVSNDFRQIKGQHINCCDSSSELREKNGIGTLFYKGSKSFGGYSRYMVIGLR